MYTRSFRHPFLLFALILVSALKPFTQENPGMIGDTVRLKEITITGTQDLFSNATPFRTDSFDLMQASSIDLGTWLSSVGLLSLRSYGPGLSYSFSTEGGNSSHTQVFWQGIPLTSLMQGQTDLSLIPVTPGTNIELIRGSQATGLTGSIYMNESLQDDTSTLLIINESIHSLIGNDLSATFEHNLGRWKSRAQFISQRSQNRFRFELDNEQKAQTHNDTRQIHLKWMQEFMIDPVQKISLSTWFHTAHRQIPPSLYEKQSDAIQEDGSLKMVLSYNFTGSKWNWRGQQAFLFDQLNYRSQEKSINSQSDARQWLTQVSGRRKTGNNEGLLQLSADWHIMHVQTNNYNKPQRIRDVSLKLDYEQTLFPGSHIQGSLAGGYRQDRLKPLAAGLEYKHLIGIRVEAGLSARQSIRFPSFNDLFWYQGGNAELLPERAREIALLLKIRNISPFGFSLRGYRRDIANWIQWLPENGVFMARNIGSIQNLGIETQLKYERHSHRMHWESGLLYHWNRSWKGTDADRRQWIYLPQNQVKNHFIFARKYWAIDLDQSWSGIVFTALDHSRYLPSRYQLNIRVSREFPLRNWRITSWISVLNVLDNEIFTVESYPLPGRIWQLGISINRSQKASDKTT